LSELHGKSKQLSAWPTSECLAPKEGDWKFLSPNLPF